MRLKTDLSRKSKKKKKKKKGKIHYSLKSEFKYKMLSKWNNAALCFQLKVD